MYRVCVCVIIIYLLTYLLTYLLHEAEYFLKANRFSASQEILHILWNLKVPYRIHKYPPPVPIYKVVRNYQCVNTS